MDNQAHINALNSLQWLDDHWRGEIQLFDARLPLLIDFDVYEPTDDDRRRAMESVEQTLPSLTPDWERRARSGAASEVIEAACSQSADTTSSEDIHRLAEEMKVESLSLTYLDDEQAVSPYLAYSCPESFPDMTLCIQFATSLLIEEVTLNEK